MNKRGDAGEGILIIMFLAIAGIIAWGIVTGVNVFFGQEHDVRGAEASVLADRVEECFMKVENEFFVQGFNIGKMCGFNKEVLKHEHLIYLNSSEGKEFSVGVLDYKNQCLFIGGKRNAAFPACVERDIEKKGKSYTLIVGSAQSSRGGFSE